MLKELSKQIAVSGAESEFGRFIQDELMSCCKSVMIDKMGNIHGYQQGDGPNICLVTYLDEPGVIVTKITDDGYLCFETVGRINPSFLVSKRVAFDRCSGVISLKAIHLTTMKEREVPVRTSQLYIDIGASSKEEAMSLVEIGDYGCLDVSYQEFGEGFIKGRAIAGRMSCNVALEILKRNKKSNIHAIFAVQREINHRGIVGCSDKIDSGFAIVLDGMKAQDYIQNNKMMPELGKGVVIVRKHAGGVMDKRFDFLCQNISQSETIPVQYGVRTEDGAEPILLKAGCNTVLSLSIPVRYADSTSPVANIADMDAMLRLTDGIINFISKEETVCK